MLQTLVVLLAATAIAVPITRRLGFGSILGYLLAGVAIGPSGAALVTDVGAISEVADLGVIMLLFLIGLELRPHRLWILRKAVFGLGIGQLVPATAVLGGLAWLTGIPWAGAVVLGAGFALSSTAIVLPMLGERNLLSSTAGRDSFAVLLFQDMAFIPLVALVPLLSGGAEMAHIPWQGVLKGVLVIAAILGGGYFLVRPIFRIAGSVKSPEVFTATSLLLVVGTAALANWAGLSVSLGAFMAGVLLSDSEYRHEVQADIEPFEGLLLGFFFISVGMEANLHLALQAPGKVAAIVAVMMAVKILLGFALGYYKRGTVQSALRFALALPEGSEFSFVLFGVAVSENTLAQGQADLATLAIAVSMVLTPILFALSESWIIPRLGTRREPVYDRIDGPPTPVIICGFGRVGQVVGRILRMQGIDFTALEKDSAQVQAVRRFGTKVFFGNPARADVLRAAGAATAKVLVIALDDMDEALAVAEMARRQFRHLKIYARARNRRHAHALMGVGLDGIIRETFFSSLNLTEMVLSALDVAPEEAHRAIELFREHDERQLVETQAIAGDEQKLIQSTQQAAQELMELFESDRPGGADPRKARGSAPGPR
jgi:CPA2 family monovalent cation:H+ antiporter-2/glutathione-regulated potassium-efflux system protein KefB